MVDLSSSPALHITSIILRARRGGSFAKFGKATKHYCVKSLLPQKNVTRILSGKQSDMAF
jgi:hypothetical protein